MIEACGRHVAWADVSVTTYACACAIRGCKRPAARHAWPDRLTVVYLCDPHARTLAAERMQEAVG